MSLKITRPYFADHARGSLFPGFKLTAKNGAGFLTPLPWPPRRGGHPPGPGAALLAKRAAVRPAQTLYRLDRYTNATQQAARTTFDPAGQRTTYTGQNVRIEWGPLAGPRTHYLASHPPATPTDHTPPT